MRISIVREAIDLDGEGGPVPVSEIRRVAQAFTTLFGVEPRIRITGRFDRSAMREVRGGDAEVDVWDLRVGSQFCDVLHVGADHVVVQMWTGINNGRSAHLLPGNGRYVRVRFLLPEPGGAT